MSTIPLILANDYSRFWEKVEVANDPESCWIWKGSNNKRYGYFRIGEKMYKANRIVYRLHHGIDPGKMHVLHTCDNPMCVNPHHLFLGDHKDNMRDMVSKGRNVHPGGGHKFRSHLQIETLRTIKKMREANRSCVVISKEIGISVDRIRRIVAGKRHKEYNSI